jgi:hypothetical protein
MWIPLYIRMWFYFLLLRSETFTEKDMTRDELLQLKVYLTDKSNRNMYMSFGWVDYNDGIVTDIYNFHPREFTSFENLMCNISYYYQQLFKYEGYRVRVDLNTLPD